MKINKHHGLYNIQKRSLSVKYIVVHYTGSGTSAAGSALANCKFFASGDKQASAHYFIDDGGIWEYADPATYYTWHCGDGRGKYGITNANSIGIEVCQNYDKPFTETEIKYLAELTRSLMTKFTVSADHVVRHYDASRKQCPLYYAKRSSEWEALRARITGAGGGWKTDGGNWYYYENGVMIKNAWRQDSKGWCYLGEDGKMVKNGWAKDSHDWCYLGSDGHLVKNKWVKDSTGWCYVGADGRIYRNRWIKDDSYYFIKKDGHMATGSVTIAETFDKAGKWTGGKQA